MLLSITSFDSWVKVLKQAGLVVSALAVAGTAAATGVTIQRRIRKKKQWGIGVSALSSRKSVTWAEVVEHDKLDNAWIVISGEVYDVTPWLEEHPGGKLLLLAFVGRDATEPFETAGHSAMAKRELRHLHRGPLHKGPGPVKSLAQSATPNRRSRTATVVAPQKMFEELWDVGERGFLPSRDPVGLEALEGTAFEAFADMSTFLPALGLTGAFRQYLENNPALQRQLQSCGETAAIDPLTEDQLERAFTVVGYTMLAYWRGGTLAYSTGMRGETGKFGEEGSCGATSDIVSQLPVYLAAPLRALSDRLKRPPMPDYAATVLYNWVRINPDGPIEPSNVRCVLRLTGLLDEEWFFKTHVVIETEAARVVTAARRASYATEDSDLLEHLVSLEEALWRVVRACLPIMYELADDGTPKCSPHVFYSVLRPLISSGSLVFEGDSHTEPLKLNGPSGAMSSIMPCIDAVLGIKMTSEKLRSTLDVFELSMPERHRKFIAELRGRPSIRDRLLWTRPPAGELSDQHEALVRSFNRCIARVLDFRWQHWHYVKNFIMKPGNISHAVGTGGTSFNYLQQHITDTENMRLRERKSLLSCEDSAGSPQFLNLRQPEVTVFPGREFWSVDGQHGLLSREPMSWANGCYELDLPEPMQSAVKELCNLAIRLPALCAAGGPIYEYCDTARGKLVALQNEHFLLGMSEANREHLMTTLCHIAAGCLCNGHRKAPQCIDKPLQVIARSVGRPPQLGFTEIILSNWTVWHDHHDHGAAGQDEEWQRKTSDKPVAKHLHIVWRFLASPDEEWYRAVHIVLHKDAREAVAAIRTGQVAMRDQNDPGVISCLGDLCIWLSKFCDYFDMRFDQKDHRTEPVLMRRLEPFICGSTVRLTWEETACWVYCCGSSVIQPMFHAFLGVRMCQGGVPESADTVRLMQTLQAVLEEGRVFMPRPHRAFLEELEKPKGNMRLYCLRRFGTKSVSIEQLHNLEVAYNDTLYALVRFLSRWKHLVSRFFPQFDSTFSQLHSGIETEMRKQRLTLLIMRQRVSHSFDDPS